MEIYCHKCGTKNTKGNYCTNCGEKLIKGSVKPTLLPTDNEKVSLECPWCSSINYVAEETNCKNCGGPLPAVPKKDSGIGRGKIPDDPPRKLPQKYIKKLKYRNVYFIIGIIFVVPFIWSVIFPIIGFFLIRHGLKVANNKIAALERGIKAEGTLLAIYRDQSITINGRHPWKLEYEFKTISGAKIEAIKTGAWNNNNRYRAAGDRLWVVYLKEDPEINAIWPPVN